MLSRLKKVKEAGTETRWPKTSAIASPCWDSVPFVTIAHSFESMNNAVTCPHPRSVRVCAHTCTCASERATEREHLEDRMQVFL
jgi:hypothetical protein